MQISSNSCQQKALQQSKQKPSQNRTSNLQLRVKLVIVPAEANAHQASCELRGSVRTAVAVNPGCLRWRSDSLAEPLKPQIRIKWSGKHANLEVHQWQLTLGMQNAHFWKTWQGALLPDLFSCSSDWTHTIRGQRLELPSFSDRAPSCCDQARCGAKSWKLQSWPNENSSEFIYLSIHLATYLHTYLPT